MIKDGRENGFLPSEYNNGFLYHTSIIQHMTVSQVVGSNNIITVSKNSMVPVVEKFYFIHPESFASYVNYITQKHHNMGLLRATPYDFNGYWWLLDIMRRTY